MAWDVGCFVDRIAPTPFIMFNTMLKATPFIYPMFPGARINRLKPHQELERVDLIRALASIEIVLVWKFSPYSGL